MGLFLTTIKISHLYLLHAFIQHQQSKRSKGIILKGA